MSNNLSHAKELYEQGWMPVPANIILAREKNKRHKKPLVKWKHCNNNPDAYVFDTFIRPFVSRPNAKHISLGIITGLQRCGTRVVVVDLDPPEDGTTSMVIPDDLIEASMETMCTTTPSGGRHLYFKYEGPLSLTNKTNIFSTDKETTTVIDLRAEGGFSVIGPSQVWEWEWQYDESNEAYRRTRPIKPSPDYRPYVTTDYLPPNELAPLPQSIIDAYTALELSRLDYSSTPKDVKKMWEKVLTQQQPDESKGETLHELLLSWSMRLVASYLDDINSPEDAEAIYKRFKDDVAYAVDKRNANPAKRQITEEYLRRLFTSAVQKLKAKRSMPYRLASPHLDPLLKKLEAQNEANMWEPLQVTKIVDYSTHLYATNDDQSKGFELTRQQFLRQQEWRAQHLVAFGPPFLPKIKTATFEELLSQIPIVQPTSMSTPKLISKMIIDGWYGDISSQEELITPDHALDTALATGRGGFLDPSTNPPSPVLFFQLRALQDALRDQGAGQMPIPKLAQILQSLDVKITSTPNIWQYD